MMKRFGIAALGLMALSACQGFQAQGDALAASAEQAVYDGTYAVGRVYADTFQDAPFDSGPVTVLAEERGELRSFQLTACRGGTHVCGNRAGHLQRAPDYYVVSGAYAGRTFYLSPGGDGYIKRNGEYLPLAWN
jgi:hypothetical protein